MAVGKGRVSSKIVPLQALRGFQTFSIGPLRFPMGSIVLLKGDWGIEWIPGGKTGAKCAGVQKTLGTWKEKGSLNGVIGG